MKGVGLLISAIASLNADEIENEALRPLPPAVPEE